MRTFLKTQFSNEACLAAGGRHFGRCLHYVVSITHDLVTLEIKSSIACILRISRLLIPLVRPKRWQGMMKVREQTLGQKERCRQRGDEEMAEQRDKVIGWRTIEQRPCQQYQGAREHLSFLLLPQSLFRLFLLFNCIHSTKVSPSVCPLELYRIRRISATWQQD